MLEKRRKPLLLFLRPGDESLVIDIKDFESRPTLFPAPHQLPR